MKCQVFCRELAGASLYGDLCSLGVQYRYGRFGSSSDISNSTTGCDSLRLFHISHLLEHMYVCCSFGSLFSMPPIANSSAVAILLERRKYGWSLRKGFMLTGPEIFIIVFSHEMEENSMKK